MYAQLFASRSTLLIGIDLHFVAALPTAATPSDQILVDLNAMNQTGSVLLSFVDKLKARYADKLTAPGV